MEAATFQTYIDDLRRNLEADPMVRGLILLGSTANAAWRDNWSDHDFWIVTETGSHGIASSWGAAGFRRWRRELCGSRRTTAPDNGL